MAWSRSCPCFTSALSHIWTILCVLLVSSFSYVTSVRYRKLCKDSDIQIMSHKGVRIEPYERSRVELMLAEPVSERFRNKLVLKFEFRSRSANGTLFYGRSSKNPKEMIALVLRDGHLQYKIKCPSLHADVRLSARGGERLNDNRWHSIHYTAKFGRYGQKGQIEVDGVKHTKRYDVNCEQLTSLVMGGHSPDIRQHPYYFDVSDHHGHFEGCIRKVSLSYFLSSPPQYYAVSQCEQ